MSPPIMKKAAVRVLMQAVGHHQDAAIFVYGSDRYPVPDQFHARIKPYKSALIKEALLTKDEQFVGLFIFTPKSFRLIRVLKIVKEDEMGLDPNVFFEEVSEDENAITTSLNVTNQFDDFWVSDHNLKVFEAVKRFATKKPVNVMITGNPGTAKTSILEAFASANEMDYIRVDCSSIRDPEEWFIYREAKDGDTVVEKTVLSQSIEAGNVVICLDDATRARPHIWNSMFSMLDDAKKTTVHNVEIVAGENIVFALTANVGWQFVGTYEIDQALSSRIDVFINMSILPKADEIKLLKSRIGVSDEVANQVVDFMTRLRSVIKSDNTQDDGMNSDDDDLLIDPSPRSSLKIARLMEVGLSFPSSVESVIKTRTTHKKLVSDVMRLTLDQKVK